MTTEELNALIAQAKGGSVEAATQLNAIAWEYQYGNNGRTIDLQMAYQLYTIAAECGNIDARATRAYCLYHGIGVEKDTQRSFQLYEQLANEGTQMGLSNLGWFYLGNSIEKALQKAIYWFTRAAEEYGNIFSMKNLTHIYGEEDGFINYEQAAKWFLELIKRDCDPNSGVYENTGYNKDLYEKVKNAVLNSATEEEMMSSMSGGNGGSLLGGAMSFTTSNAKSYINQAEEIIKRKNDAIEEAKRKEEEDKAQKAETEKANLIKQIEKDYEILDYILAKDYPFKNLSGFFEIPIGTKRIGEYAFTNRSNLTSIIIPDSVTSIGRSAFESCAGLTSIIIPSSVTRIGAGAFESCTGLTSIELPDSIMNIEENTFSYCSELMSVKIGNNVISIGSWAFFECNNLLSITVPDSVVNIEECAFANCSKLVSVRMGKGAMNIGIAAFQDCTSLKVIIVPKGAKQRYEQMKGLEKYKDIIIEE